MSKRYTQCVVCAAPPATRDSKYCLAHKDVGRQRTRLATSERLKRQWVEWKEKGVDPTHGGEPKAIRAASIRRRNEAGVAGRALAQSETCDRGHAYTDENTYIDPRGWRVCKTCRRAAQSKARR